MLKLEDAVAAWDSTQFDRILKEALLQVDPVFLGLQSAAAYSGFFVDNSLQFSILSRDASETCYLVSIGIYFQEYMTTCPCSGEQPELFNGYCEKKLCIDITDATVSILND